MSKHEQAIKDELTPFFSQGEEWTRVDMPAVKTDGDGVTLYFKVKDGVSWLSDGGSLVSTIFGNEERKPEIERIAKMFGVEFVDDEMRFKGCEKDLGNDLIFMACAVVAARQRRIMNQYVKFSGGLGKCR